MTNENCGSTVIVKSKQEHLLKYCTCVALVLLECFYSHDFDQSNLSNPDFLSQSLLTCDVSTSSCIDSGPLRGGLGDH